LGCLDLVVVVLGVVGYGSVGLGGKWKCDFSFFEYFIVVEKVGVLVCILKMFKL